MVVHFDRLHGEKSMVQSITRSANCRQADTLPGKQRVHGVGQSMTQLETALVI